MDFQQAIKSCFNKFVTFSGRASRSEYWYWLLFNFILLAIATVADGAIFGEPVPGQEPVEIFSTIVSLFLLLPNLAVAARRMHDINRSGWWILINFIPLAGFIIWIIWACKKGDSGDNRFGSDPLAKPAGTI